MDMVQRLQTLADQLKKDFAAGQKDKLDAALAQIESTVAAAIEMSKEVKLTAVLQDPDLLHCTILNLRPDEYKLLSSEHNLMHGEIGLNRYRFGLNNSNPLLLPEPPQKIIVLMYKKTEGRS